jgi:hypothetical protein
MKRYLYIFLVCLLPACAGVSRGCSSFWATAAGSDWVIVQLDAFGKIIRCWQLEGVSVTNEDQSDGIYWKDETGNLVHLSGFYNRVQVHARQWDAAFESLGLKGNCKANLIEESPKP